MQNIMSQGDLVSSQLQNQQSLISSLNQNNTKIQCLYCQISSFTPLHLVCGHVICWDCAESIKFNQSNEEIQYIECTLCKQATQFTDITQLYQLATSPIREDDKDEIIQESHFISNSPKTYQQNNFHHHKIQNYQFDDELQQIQQIQTGLSQLNHSMQMNQYQDNNYKINKMMNPHEQEGSAQKNFISKQQALQVDNNETYNNIFETLKPQIQEANYCSIHQEEISLYCTSEKQLCCVQCVYQTQHHKKHNIVPIKQALQTLREENQSFIQACNEKNSQIEESIKYCTLNKQRLGKIISQYRQLLSAEFEKIIQLVNKREEEALNHIQIFQNQSIQDYDSKLENLQFIKNCIKEYSDIEKTQEYNSQETTVYLYNIQSMLKNTLKNFPIKTLELKCESIEIVEMNQRHLIQQELQNLGKCKVKSYLASQLNQIQQSSTYKKQSRTSTQKNKNISLSRQNISQNQKDQAINTPKPSSKSPNQKSPLKNIKSITKEQHLKEMHIKMNNLSSGMNNASRSTSPLNSENPQKERPSIRLSNSKSTANFTSNKQTTQTTPKQATKRKIQVNDQQASSQFSTQRIDTQGKCVTPNGKYYKKQLEIVVNTSPNKNEVKPIKRSLTPNLQTKKQIFSSNYGYSVTNKQQITPKRENKNLFPVEKVQHKRKSQISGSKQSFQSKGSQQEDENYQTSHPSNNFGQQPIQQIHSEVKSKVDSNCPISKSNKNRSESPLYINVNDIQSKYRLQNQICVSPSGGYKGLHAQKVLNQNNSNSNLKTIPTNSSINNTNIIYEQNMVPQILKQQQKSQSYTNLHQQRMSSQDFQSSSQNSVQTLQVEKVSHFSSQCQNQVNSCQESTQIQISKENQVNYNKQIDEIQRQNSNQSNVLCSITNIQINQQTGTGLNQSGQMKRCINNQQLNQTSHFQNETVGSFLEKEEALMKINSASSNKLQNSSKLLANSKQFQNQQTQDVQSQFQDANYIQDNQNNYDNNSQSQQISNIINHQEQQKINSFIMQQQQQLMELQKADQQQSEQFAEEENMKNSSKVNDTLFQNQRSSMFNCQQDEINDFSLFKQQQLSPINHDQIDSQYFDHQSSPQSLPNNTYPAPFNCANTQIQFVQQQQNEMKQLQQSIEQNKKINEQQNYFTQQNHQQQNHQQQSYQQQSHYQQSQCTEEIQNVSSYYINNNQYNHQIQNKSQTFESQDNQVIQQIQSQFLNSQYIDQQNNQQIEQNQQIKSQQKMSQQGEQVNNRSLNESQKQNNRNNLTNENIQYQFEMDSKKNHLNNSQQINLSNDNRSLPHPPQNCLNQHKNQQEDYMNNQQYIQSNTSNDNLSQNSQFSFTPNAQNQYHQQYQIQQEQVTVFNNLIHTAQNKQINSSQASLDSSYRQPSIKQLNFQNDLITLNQESANFIDNSSNNEVISTKNSSSIPSKSQQQIISSSSQDNIQNSNQINNYISEQINNQEQLLQSLNPNEKQYQINQLQSSNGQQNQGINFYDSKIFNSQIFENPSIMKILPANIKKTKLLYRLTEDGQSSQMFHRKCDGQGPTITYVKANGEHIFGYYMPIAFCRNDQYSTTDKCFIFTLQNSINIQPTRFEIKPEKKFISIYQNSKNPCLGSTLNGKQDLIINFDVLEKSCSNIGYAYKIDSNIQGDKILAGQYTDWNISEIEIFGLTF